MSTSKPRARKATAFFADRLFALDAALAAAMQRVVADADPEAVHDLRVNLRKLRVVGRAARPLYGRAAVEPLREACKRALDATGAQREAQVLAQTLSRNPVHAAHSPADTERLASINGIRLQLRALATSPAENDRSIRRLARRSVDRALRKVQQRAGEAGDDVESLHALRAAAKQLRYTVELFQDQCPDLTEVAFAAEAIQGRLGRVHDLDDAIAAIGRAQHLSEARRRATLAALRARRRRELSCWKKDKLSPRLAPLHLPGS